MQETRKRWPLEFKICAVTLSNQYKSVDRVAQELGITKHSLQHWKKLYKMENLPFRNRLIPIRTEKKY